MGVAQPEGFALTGSSLPLLQCKRVNGVEGLRHGITTRAGGSSSGPYASLNLSPATDDKPEVVEANRQFVAKELGFEILKTPTQVHGNTVQHVRSMLDRIGEVDALITDAKGVLLGVLGADCPGVLLVDERNHALGLAHCGWRGVAARIVAQTVQAMRATFKSNPTDLIAMIGPAISRPHYQVSGEVGDALSHSVAPLVPSSRAIKITGDGRTWADIGALIRMQLEQCGLLDKSIVRYRGCTFHQQDMFFSHRRDEGVTGRNAVVAGWAE